MSAAGPLPRRSLPLGGKARSAEGAPKCAAGPPQRADCSTFRGSAAALAASVGGPCVPPGPSQGAGLRAAYGGSATASTASVGGP